MKTNPIFSSVLFLAFLISAPLLGQSWYGAGIKGEGPKVTQELDLAPFDALSLNISGKVYLRQGSPQSVKVEAQENILENISTEVSDNTWKIKFEKNVRTHEDVKIWVTVPRLTMAAVSGSGDIIGESHFTDCGDFRMAVSGSGGIDLESDSESLKVSISGSGDVEMGGKTGECKIRISGSGDVEGFDMEMESCLVKISGSGDATVNVRESLEVSIAGSGDVVYKGSPKVRSKISGSGDVSAN